MEYYFIKSGRFLNLEFNSTPLQVKAILGDPENVERYYYQGLKCIEYDDTFFYDGKNLRIVFSFIEMELENTSIFVKKLFVEDVDIFSLKKNEIIEIFEKLSDIKDGKSLVDKSFVDDYISEEFFFADLGVSLWFENDILDEVCFEKPQV